MVLEEGLILPPPITDDIQAATYAIVAAQLNLFLLFVITAVF